MSARSGHARRGLAALAAVAAIGLALSGCAGGASDSPSRSRTPSASASPALSGTVTVYGAASLTASFTTLARAFEKAHPGVTVQTTFNGSGVLVTQLQQGAPADVFAAADEKPMDTLEQGGLLGDDRVDFATNTLEIAVPPDNPAKIRALADLAEPGVKTVICQAAQPCGAATVELEKKTGVQLSPVSEQASVTAVLTQVTTGQADAGLVYVTDVKGAGSAVKGIPLEDADEVVNRYPIASLKDAANPDAARAFVAFVTGKTGRGVLAAAGFGRP